MFSSLFSKLMTIYLIIILITLIILGLFLSSSLQKYTIQSTEDELIREAKELNRHYELYDKGWVSRDYIELICDGITKYENTSIWVVRIVGDVGLLQFQYNTKGIEEMELAPFNKDELVNVLRGNIFNSIGKFGDRFSVPVLTVGLPLELDDKIKGAIFFHTPVEDLNMVLYGLYMDIWKAILISAALSLLLLYWITYRISKPLIQMNEITRQIASGDYRKRVSVKSRDETGQLAISFNAMADSLEGVEEMRRVFVANVSHELRSPLTSIIGYVQAILDGTSKEEDLDKYLSIVLDESERLSLLIDELLDLSQIESGQFPIKYDDFDINELIRRILISQENRISAKEIDLNINFENENCIVRADRERISQVILNLVDNAIKFNMHGGSIGIETWTQKEKTFIKIEDSGIGIPEKELKNIWDRFYQTDKSRGDFGRGTGLGLSIVKKIIDEHNERIYINSIEGEGTFFIFSLEHKA